MPSGGYPRGQPRRTFSDAGLSGASALGRRVSIFWEGAEDGDAWYPGTVVEFDHAKNQYWVKFDDGDSDWCVRLTAASESSRAHDPTHTQQPRASCTSPADTEKRRALRLTMSNNPHQN